MRLTKTLVVAAFVATAATTSMAGGLAPTPAPTVVVEVPEVEAPRSSWGIILPIVGAAALIALAASGS